MFNIYRKLFASVSPPGWRNNNAGPFEMTKIGCSPCGLTPDLAGDTRGHHKCQAVTQPPRHPTKHPLLQQATSSPREGRVLSTMQGFVSKRLQPPPPPFPFQPAPAPFCSTQSASFVALNEFYVNFTSADFWQQQHHPSY